MSFFFPGMGGMGGGGFPGMGGDDDGDQGGQEEIDNEKYYKILGVDKKASDTEIKKQYKKLARELHPDKHPEDPETYQKKFVEMQAAYEVLGDADKRQLYDKYGEAGVKGGGGGGSGMGDIFDMFFGGHGGGGGRGRGGGAKQQAKKAPVIRIPLDVTLEDIYMGSTKKLSFKRYRQCKDCNGKGGKKVIECSDCNGRGVQVVMQRMGFVTMQSQRQCSKCDGEGTIIREEDKCKKCQGKGLTEEKVDQNFDIPLGSKHAEQVTLRGQGHEVPNAANGDIVVILRVEKHPVFQRVGADLAMNYELTLKEALCGYNVHIKHFGNRVVHLRSKLGETTQPSQLKVVYGLGMPQKNSGHVKGNLYIKFEIKLPENGALTNDTLQQIGKLLPNSPSDLMDQKDEKERLEKAEKDEKRKKKKKNKKNNKKDAKKNNSNKPKNDQDEDGDMDVDQDDEDHDDDMQTIDIDAEAHPVDGEPKATPYSAKSAYDEDDEEQEGVKCQHM